MIGFAAKILTTILDPIRQFIHLFYPVINVLKNRIAVEASIAKNAHPKLTAQNVINQLKIAHNFGYFWEPDLVFKITQFLCNTKRPACHKPQRRKLIPAPCQSPLTIITPTILRIVRQNPNLEPPKGIKM